MLEATIKNKDFYFSDNVELLRIVEDLGDVRLQDLARWQRFRVKVMCTFDQVRKFNRIMVGGLLDYAENVPETDENEETLLILGPGFVYGKKAAWKAAGTVIEFCWRRVVLPEDMVENPELLPWTIFDFPPYRKSEFFIHRVKAPIFWEYNPYLSLNGYSSITFLKCYREPDNPPPCEYKFPSAEWIAYQLSIGSYIYQFIDPSLFNKEGNWLVWSGDFDMGLDLRDLLNLARAGIQLKEGVSLWQIRRT